MVACVDIFHIHVSTELNSLEGVATFKINCFGIESTSMEMFQYIELYDCPSLF